MGQSGEEGGKIDRKEKDRLGDKEGQTVRHKGAESGREQERPLRKGREGHMLAQGRRSDRV